MEINATHWCFVSGGKLYISREQHQRMAFEETERSRESNGIE